MSKRINLGRWSQQEDALILAGAPVSLVTQRTGRSKDAVIGRRYRLQIEKSIKINEVPVKRFLAEERAALKEIPSKRKITLEELRKKRGEPNIIKEDVARAEKMAAEIIEKHSGEWKSIGAGEIYVKKEDTPPNPEELFFNVNGTRVTVSAGTKKVDVTPYGLIIEF